MQKHRRHIFTGFKGVSADLLDQKIEDTLWKGGEEWSVSPSGYFTPKVKHSLPTTYASVLAPWSRDRISYLLELGTKDEV